MARRPKVAIVCGTNYLRRRECDRFVDSCVATLDDVDWRVYLGDVSPPEHVLYAHRDPRVTVVREWPRAGVSAGYNRLAGLVPREDDWHLTWANDDATYWRDGRQPSALHAAILALDAEPRAACAVGYYQTPHPPDGWHVNEFPAGQLYPNFGLFRRSAFVRCGGFDPRVKMYGMDNALCFRLLNGSPDPNRPGVGGAMLAVPGFKVIHHYAEDESRAKNMSRESALNAAWPDVFAEWQPHLHRLATVQARLPRQPLAIAGDVRTYQSMFGGHGVDAQPSERAVVN